MLIFGPSVFYLLKIAVTSRQTEKVVDIMATGMECYRKVKTLEMVKGQRKGLLLKLAASPGALSMNRGDY